MERDLEVSLTNRHWISSQTVFLGAVILIVGIVYLNSLGNMFTNWDDSMIYANPGIRSLSGENLLSMFTPRKGATYQPVRVLSYALDYHFWGLKPVGYHITNIVFYMLTCVTIFLALQLVSADLREDASPDSHRRGTWKC